MPCLCIAIFAAGRVSCDNFPELIRRTAAIAHNVIAVPGNFCNRPRSNCVTQMSVSSDQEIQGVPQLEERLSRPTPGVVKMFADVPGDFVVLGAAGKMGPSLTRMIQRGAEAAGSSRRVIAVSRFSSPGKEAALRAHGIETIGCDLLDEAAVARLPDAPNVLFMAGMKFGSTGQEATTWAMNTYLPAIVCKKYSRSRIVAFSTGNVYGLSSIANGGSTENDTPAPVGEYAMSCLGRERMFEYFSRKFGTPMAIIRLNYACDLRYGVLVDLAQQIGADRPVDLAMGHFNTIWQGDANAMTLQAFAHTASPPFVINITGPETLAVRDVCERLGRLMQKTVQFTGTESPAALLSNARRSFELFGSPAVSTDELLHRVAEWLMRGGPTLGKPTHFESRDGKF